MVLSLAYFFYYLYGWDAQQTSLCVQPQVLPPGEFTGMMPVPLPFQTESSITVTFMSEVKSEYPNLGYFQIYDSVDQNKTLYYK